MKGIGLALLGSILLSCRFLLLLRFLDTLLVFWSVFLVAGFACYSLRLSARVAPARIRLDDRQL